MHPRCPAATSAGSGDRANRACRTGLAGPPRQPRCAGRRPRLPQTGAVVRCPSSRCRTRRVAWHRVTPRWRRADDVGASAVLSRMVGQPLKMPSIRRAATQFAVCQKTLVVAAYGDGTIRWHRMSDGQELLAFYPLPDRQRWVAWTPEGYYAAAPGTAEVLGW